MIVSFIKDETDKQSYQLSCIKTECISGFTMCPIMLNGYTTDIILIITCDGKDYKIHPHNSLSVADVEMEVLNLMWGNDEYKYQIFSIETKHIN